MIDQYSLGYVHAKNKGGASPTVCLMKKRKKTKYDRACARDCVFHDWMDLMMVEYIVMPFLSGSDKLHCDRIRIKNV